MSSSVSFHGGKRDISITLKNMEVITNSYQHTDKKFL